jgi:hypothetical protein
MQVAGFVNCLAVPRFRPDHEFRHFGKMASHDDWSKLNGTQEQLKAILDTTCLGGAMHLMIEQRAEKCSNTSKTAFGVSKLETWLSSSCNALSVHNPFFHQSKVIYTKN